MMKLLLLFIPLFVSEQKQPVPLEEWLVESHAPLSLQEESASQEIAEERELSTSETEKNPSQMQVEKRRKPLQRERRLRAKRLHKEMTQEVYSENHP